MRSIVRQAYANLRSRRLQATLILITLCAAATLLTLSLSSLHAARGAYDRLLERTQGAHLWLELDPAHVSATQAEQLLNGLPCVEATTAVMNTISGTIFLGEDRLGGVLLREWPAQPVSVDRDLLVAGRAPEPGEASVIVLDRNMAAYHGAQVGDAIDILTPVGRQSLTVVGLYVSAEFCPYGTCWPPRNYLAPGAFSALGLSTLHVPDTGRFDVGLRLKAPNDTRAALREAGDALPAESVVNWATWQGLRRNADGAIRNWRILLVTFSTIAGLAASFLIANTVGETVRSQRRQIGLLKAVGFTGSQLAAVYLFESLWLALLAGLGGLLVGWFAASVILRPVVAMFGESLARSPLWITLIVPLSTLIVSALSSFFAVHRASRVNTVEVIRTGSERPGGRAAGLARGPLTLAVGLADVLSHPLRTTLTALGLAMAVITLTAALILNATFDAFFSDPGLMGFDGDLFVHRTSYLPDDEVRRLIAAQPDVVATYIERWAGFQFDGDDEVLNARFREGDLHSFTFPIIEGRMVESVDEVVVGYGLFRERDIQVGEVLTILLEGETVSLEVVGTYRENSNMGRMLMLPLETLRAVMPEVEIYSYVLKLRAGSDSKALAESLSGASGQLLEVEVAGQEGLSSDLAMSQKVMLALCLVMGGIAGLGVLSSLWVGVQERRREFGMLKAVGMTPIQITFSVILGAVVIALLGYTVGLPIGLFGVRMLMDMVARWVGFGPLSPPMDWVDLALVLPGIVLLAVIGALIPARRAGRVSVIEVLRYE